MKSKELRFYQTFVGKAVYVARIAIGLRSAARLIGSAIPNVSEEI